MIKAKDARMQELQSKTEAKEEALYEKMHSFSNVADFEANMQAMRAAGIDGEALQAILAAERDMNASNVSSWY